MIITVLGTGTSSGVPLIGCQCDTCTSSDPRDKRLRCSIHIQSEKTSIVIDTSADFRQQMLSNNINRLDAIFYTHHHFDHISGFDDIRAYNYLQNMELPIYASKETMEHLKRAFPYSFEIPEQIGGGVPLIKSNYIEDKSINFQDIEMIPLELFHGKLKVLGFRIGDFAYCTDTNYIPERTQAKLQNLDYLIIDALRYEPHPTHYNVEQALEMIEIINPKQAYFTHISHHIKHSDLENKLPSNVKIAFDGMKIEV